MELKVSYTKIRNVLNKDFANACEWFVDNKLSIHIRVDKTKSFLFLKLNMTCDTNRIKQLYVVEYLGCYLDADLRSMQGVAVLIYTKSVSSVKNYVDCCVTL